MILWYMFNSVLTISKTAMLPQGRPTPHPDAFKTSSSESALAGFLGQFPHMSGVMIVGYYKFNLLKLDSDEQANRAGVLYLRKRVTLALFRFGTKSLGIHIKSCQKKWENEQALKPPRERRPCPQPPKGLGEMLQKDNITKNDINSMNSGAFETYKEEGTYRLI